MRSKLDGIADVHAWRTTRDAAHTLLPDVRTERQRSASPWLSASLYMRRTPAVKHPVMQAKTASDCQARLSDVARHGRAVEQTLSLPCTVGNRLNLNSIVFNDTWLSSSPPSRAMHPAVRSACSSGPHPARQTEVAGDGGLPCLAYRLLAIVSRLGQLSPTWGSPMEP